MSPAFPNCHLPVWSDAVEPPLPRQGAGGPPYKRRSRAGWRGRLTSERIPAPSSCVTETLWFVAHTKPRCEKKFAQHCQRERVSTTLPCCKSVRRYRGKVCVFMKPLFPGYVFLRLATDQRRLVQHNDYLARLLPVTDQALFARQLDEILLALASDVEVRLAPTIGEGSRVKIKSGPLRGLDGWVEQRQGPTQVLLRLDFIGQAAAIQVGGWELEPI